MAKKITSHNQSGGITAENVSIGENTKEVKRKRTLYKIMYWIVGIATIIGTIVVVLQFFGYGGQP